MTKNFACSMGTRTLDKILIILMIESINPPTSYGMNYANKPTLHRLLNSYRGIIPAKHYVDISVALLTLTFICSVSLSASRSATVLGTFAWPFVVCLHRIISWSWLAHQLHVEIRSFVLPSRPSLLCRTRSNPRQCYCLPP